MSSSFSGKVRIPLRRNTPAAASAGADWSGASPGGRGSPPEGSGVRGSALAAGLLLPLPLLPSGSAPAAGLLLFLPSGSAAPALPLRQPGCVTANGAQN